MLIIHHLVILCFGKVTFFVLSSIMFLNLNFVLAWVPVALLFASSIPCKLCLNGVSWLGSETRAMPWTHPISTSQALKHTLSIHSLFDSHPREPWGFNTQLPPRSIFPLTPVDFRTPPSINNPRFLSHSYPSILRLSSFILRPCTLLPTSSLQHLGSSLSTMCTKTKFKSILVRKVQYKVIKLLSQSFINLFFFFFFSALYIHPGSRPLNRRPH